MGDFVCFVGDDLLLCHWENDQECSFFYWKQEYNEINFFLHVPLFVKQLKKYSQSQV